MLNKPQSLFRLKLALNWKSFAVASQQELTVGQGFGFLNTDAPWWWEPWWPQTELTSGGQTDETSKFLHGEDDAGKGRVQ